MNTNETGGVYRRCGCTDPMTGKRLGGRCPRLEDDPEHGSWYFAVQIHDGQPSPTRIRRGGYRTARKAATARDEVLATVATGGSARRVTVEQWLLQWLQALPGRVCRSTAAGYGIHVNRYLIPYLGRYPLAGLRAGHIEGMFTAIAAQRTKSGNPMAAVTLQRIRATLRRALNMAIREGLLQVNAARLVLLPHPQRHRPQSWTTARVAAWRDDGQRPTVAVWTPIQLAQFLVFVRDDPLFALWWLAALRGLRRGEVCALRWTDLDLADRTLTVNHNIAHAHGRPYLDAPKTAAGQRTIALDTATTAVLREHQRRQRLLLRDIDAGWRPGGPVFTAPDGQALRPDWLTHRFATLVTASGLPPIRLHDLRHGAATLALAAGADLKTVQDMLGHTSYAFTADTYTAVLPENAKKAAEATAHLILDAIRQQQPTTAHPARTRDQQHPPIMTAVGGAAVHPHGRPRDSYTPASTPARTPVLIDG
ncbi:tyrosine-type recombinase/integrase [Paractinoplanes rhizophilus]|uniref:Tyrosine-type recombinase/integrase n=1 Tax=Paractinoplanes rhizophilus TaxID=1416877 RepID=A0ABW2I2X3_9ACTN